MSDFSGLSGMVPQRNDAGPFAGPIEAPAILLLARPLQRKRAMGARNHISIKSELAVPWEKVDQATL
jgi:hypothetical protein